MHIIVALFLSVELLLHLARTEAIPWTRQNPVRLAVLRTFRASHDWEIDHLLAGLNRGVDQKLHRLLLAEVRFTLLRFLLKSPNDPAMPWSLSWLGIRMHVQTTIAKWLGRRLKR